MDVPGDLDKIRARDLVRRFCGGAFVSLKKPMYVLFSYACKRRVCGKPSEVLVPRTEISRSSALVLLFSRMFVREEIAEVQVKSVVQGHGSLGAAPLFFSLKCLKEKSLWRPK